MVVMITGSSSGIGAASARAFAGTGVRLVLAARRRHRLEALAAELQTETHLLELDVRDRAAVSAAISGLAPPFNEIEILVNNAGLSRGLVPLHDGCEDDWEEMIDTNLKGLLYVTRAVLPGMVARGRGHVINVGSIAGYEVYPGGNVYCATKAAVRALNKALRLDLAATGIRVSTVDPGMVDTEFSEVRFHGDRVRAGAVYRDTRPLSAADVAEAILWCATRPSWVNVEEMLLMPTDQAAAGVVHRRPLTPAALPATEPLAQRWLNAWNAHDLEAIVALHAPDARYSSRGLLARDGRSDTIEGREALREHFRQCLQQSPRLRFELICDSVGPRTVALEYHAREVPLPGRRVELLELDMETRIRHARTYHQ
jgi:3-hydroxy acid dehydrogenase/malonic semialdehyde reductase